MIHFDIISPTIAKITASFEEKEALKKELSYKNLSAYFLYNKHMAKRWLESKDPEYFQEEAARLKEEINKNLLFKDNGGNICTYPGIIPYVKMPYTSSNSIEYPEFKPINWTNKPEHEPYDFQWEIVNNLLKEKHAYAQAATGLGKTLCMLMLAKESGLRVVVTTPSQTIFAEICRSMEAAFGKNKVGKFGDGFKDMSKSITVAINKSLSMIKEGTPQWEFFSKKQMLVIDEAHVFSAETLEETCHGVLSDIPYRFFLTATAIRADGSQKLLDSIIGPRIFSMDIKEGIEKGYLCPLKFKILSTFSPSTLNIKDPIENKRVHFLRNQNIADLAAKIANASWSVKQESTLILVEELGQIEMLKKLLTVPFTYVHSGSKKDAAEYGLLAVNAQDEIEKFNKGEVRVLVGTKSISIGVNFYSCHNTINWTGSGSEVSTKQGAVGRSTRLLENSKYKEFHKPKPFSTIFDFDVKGQSILKKQLEKRIEFYEETGISVVY